MNNCKRPRKLLKSQKINTFCSGYYVLLQKDLKKLISEWIQVAIFLIGMSLEPCLIILASVKVDRYLHTKKLKPVNKFADGFKNKEIDQSTV